tara:strand:- start:3214 stop:3399 length:186 start_codon:yes stop_codon:yes gene_type:complete
MVIVASDVIFIVAFCEKMVPEVRLKTEEQHKNKKVFIMVSSMRFPFGKAILLKLISINLWC